jgi:hypothetical protein
MFLNTIKEVLAENTLSKGCVAEKKARKKPQKRFAAWVGESFAALK